MRIRGLVRTIKKVVHRKRVTRGSGVLEYFLAGQRARLANSFLRSVPRSGRLLDIGCGFFPVFLLTSKFTGKYAIERNACENPCLRKRINFLVHDINRDDTIHVADGFVDAVTMLAVLEHIDNERVARLFSEICRILKPGGFFIITVPSLWADGLLKCLSCIGLVSRIEIAEHRPGLNTATIMSLLTEAGFDIVRSGNFELFMNRYFVLKKARIQSDDTGKSTFAQRPRKGASC